MVSRQQNYFNIENSIMSAKYNLILMYEKPDNNSNIVWYFKLLSRTAMDLKGTAFLSLFLKNTSFTKKNFCKDNYLRHYILMITAIIMIITPHFISRVVHAALWHSHYRLGSLHCQDTKYITICPNCPGHCQGWRILKRGSLTKHHNLEMHPDRNIAAVISNQWTSSESLSVCTHFSLLMSSWKGMWSCHIHWQLNFKHANVMFTIW